MPVKALLMDLDGVLVEACDWHYIALNKALKHAGWGMISRTEHEITYNALPTLKKLELLANQGRIMETDIEPIFNLKQKFTIETIHEQAVRDPIKIELHEATKALGIKSACVTNSITETATLMLKSTGQWDYMKFLISNEMVKNAKPHGEGYIRAMIMLSAMPEETLIVEDSEKGLQAALSTGAHVLKVHDCADVTKDKILSRLKEIG